MLLDCFGIVLRNCLHRGEVALDTLLLEGGFVEVGIRSNEQAGLAFDGGAEGFEVAPSLGRDEDERLLGLIGDGDGGPFRSLLVPCVNFSKPVVGWFIGGAAEEGDDEQEVIGLGGGKIGLDPDLVAGLQVGHLGDGERDASSGDADVDFWASEVKARVVVGVERCGKGNGEQAGENVRESHLGLVRRQGGRRGCGGPA